MEEDGLKTNEKPWLFKKGNLGGPGRPKGSGKSLKEYSREFLTNMTEEEKMDYLEGLPKEVIWKMAEGNPDTKGEERAPIILPVLVKFLNKDGTDNS